MQGASALCDGLMIEAGTIRGARRSPWGLAPAPSLSQNAERQSLLVAE